ncbi:oligosaccharide flippase family protein [Patescibacteria group bacterium]|nr:oligosaccharide flippase family protein [Patescibacteria group bacterium]
MNKKILKNTFFLSGSQVVARTIGFLYFVVLARVFSVEDFGILAWVLGFGYNFYPLADFGIERVVLKDVSREPKKRGAYLARLIPLKIILAIASVLISILLALVLGLRGFKLFLVFVFVLSMLPYNLVFLFAAFDNAREKVITFTISTMAVSLTSVVLGLSMFKMGFGLGGILFGYFLSSLAVLIWFLSGERSKKFVVKWKIDWQFNKKILSRSWVFASFLVLAVFYLRTPLILTGIILGDHAAGIFGAASKFIEAGILIPQSLALALFPSFSKMILKNKSRLKKEYLKNLSLLFLFSLPIGIVMFLLGKPFMGLVYGQNYLVSGEVFSLFGLVMVLFFVNSLPGNIIQTSKKPKVFLPWSAANFLVALISGLVLIPRVGLVGGVFALLIGEVFGLIINNLFVFKILNSGK